MDNRTVYDNRTIFIILIILIILEVPRANGLLDTACYESLCSDT